MYSTAVTALSGDAAVDSQEAAARKGNFEAMGMYQQAREDVKPWMEAGTKALGQMQDADYMKDFSMADFQADPGYAFRMQEGQKALERSAAARGGLNSGGTMKALTRYGQDMGTQEYGNAYNRFNADRDRRFGRLNTLSSGGQQAAMGLINPSMNLGNLMNTNAIGVGEAQAGNHLRTGEAINKGIASGMSMMAGGAGGGGGGMGGMSGGGGGASGGSSAAGGSSMMAMFCDRRLKKDIKPLDPEKLAELKKYLKAYSYEYIDTKHGDGEFIGVMAQDLQKAELGRDLVFTDQDGHLRIDAAKTINLLLAALAGA
jgi:hypothetical protein